MQKNNLLLLATALTASLVTSLSWAKRPPEQPQALTSAIENKHAACDEEARFADPWIRWAVASRAACMAASASAQQQSACLVRARTKLAEIEQEHANTYLTQIKSLDPGHPAVKTILARLRSNRETAAIGIDQDAEPMELALLRKQRCIKEAVTPSVNRR